MLKKSYLGLVLALICLTANTSQAQPDPGGDPDVPITGIEYLIAGGALLGIRKLMRSRKQTPN